MYKPYQEKSPLQISLMYFSSLNICPCRQDDFIKEYIAYSRLESLLGKQC